MLDKAGKEKPTAINANISATLFFIFIITVIAVLTIAAKQTGRNVNS